MSGLAPGIHQFAGRFSVGMDRRVKPGDDRNNCAATNQAAFGRRRNPFHIAVAVPDMSTRR
jgi:hypothetical protein